MKVNIKSIEFHWCELF